MRKKKRNNYSISETLRSKNKSNDYFEILLNNLTLEEVIALKLELGYRAIGFPLHSYPVWKSLNFIIKDAVLKFALSISDTKKDAASLLGLVPSEFFVLLRRYSTRDYFNKGKENDNNG